MKKLYILLSCIFIFLIVESLNVHAASVGYENVITDTSSIEEDFEILGMDLSNYTKFNKALNKSYIIAYSESILDNNDIQSYIYVYLSYDNKKNLVKDFNFSYRINGKDYSFDKAVELENINDYLFKIKGFTYTYQRDVDINIKLEKMNCLVEKNDSDLNSNPNDSLIEQPNINYYEDILIPESKYFSVSISHSLISDNKPFEMELAYDSVMLIEKWTCKSIQIPSSSNFFQMIGEAFSSIGSGSDLQLIFYNFDFPDNISPDSILQAVFNYDYNVYTAKIGSTKEPTKDYEHSYKASPIPDIKGNYNDEDLGVYSPKTHTFKASKFSKELSFETFVLGNRVEKGEFDYVDMSDLKNDFDFDCSILLGSTYTTYFYESQTKEYSQMENIEFIEMTYEKDGIVYKCQVISETVEKPEPEFPEKKKEWWEIFWEWFMENLPESAFICIAIVILIPIIIALCPQVLGFILKGIIWLFKSIIKILVWILKLPFKLLGGLFKLFRGKK